MFNYNAGCSSTSDGTDLATHTVGGAGGGWMPLDNVASSATHRCDAAGDEDEAALNFPDSIVLRSAAGG